MSVHVPTKKLQIVESSPLHLLPDHGQYMDKFAILRSPIDEGARYPAAVAGSEVSASKQASKTRWPISLSTLNKQEVGSRLMSGSDRMLAVPFATSKRLPM